LSKAGKAGFPTAGIVADAVRQHHRHRATAAQTQFPTALQVATRLSALSRVWQKIEIHEPIFFRSAQRFFIANDILLLPSGVRALPCFPFTFIGRIEATVAFFTVPNDFAPSSAAIARVSLSLSCLSSTSIFSLSKLYPSFGLVDLARSFPPSPSELSFLLCSRPRALTIATPREAAHSDFALAAHAEPLYNFLF
jgi:hypothetical protein